MSRYPFTPEMLDAIPNSVVKLYRALEEKLLAEICERINLAGKANEIVLNDIRILRERGISQSYIDKMIEEYTHKSKEEIDRIYDDAASRNQQYYQEVIDKAAITKPYRPFSFEQSLQTVEMMRIQTENEFTNLTRSMGFLVMRGGQKVLLPPAKSYQWALDNAEIQIKSGAISYNQAIRSAVKQLADSGIKTVQYESGHVDHVDVAVRRAVMTGVAQICDRYTEEAAEEIGTTLFEVSAHQGARDIDGPKGWENHKKWQGRWYSTEHGGKYPNIHDACGLGEVDGLEGANCRHRRFAVVEGISSRTYTDEQLKNIDPPPIIFQGRTYTAYEATQKQRQIERTIRKLKRETKAFESAGLNEDAQNAKIKARRLTANYKAFSEAAKLPMQKERIKAVY